MSKSEERMANAIRDMISATDRYCMAYSDVHDGAMIGDDGVLGDCGMAPILRGLRQLLNGPTGTMDCAIMDREILDIAKCGNIDEADL